MALPLLLEYTLHVDRYLAGILLAYGKWVYFIVFLVIFSETGLVIAPFLPGDSLLFAVGALAAVGPLNIWALLSILSLAAIIGDSLNYWVGNLLGPAVLRKEKLWFLRREYVQRTEEFYKKHGGKTILLARFVPIVRTFAPFMAGVGSMPYPEFLFYNVIGGLAWVGGFLFGGYFFGNIPFVRENFSLVILAIIAVSMLPMAVGLWKHRLQARKKNKPKRR